MGASRVCLALSSLVLGLLAVDVAHAEQAYRVTYQFEGTAQIGYFGTGPMPVESDVPVFTLSQPIKLLVVDTTLDNRPATMTLHLAGSSFDFAYPVSGSVNSVGVLSFNSALGTAFLLTRLGTEYPGVLGGDFGPRTYAGGLLFAIDPAFAIPGGYARLQGTMQDYTFTQTMVPVPEPEAWALLSLGLAALAWRRRRAA